MLTPNIMAKQATTSAFKLNDLSVIYAEGEDAEKFLQGQLSADVAALLEQEWRFAGHCDNKGKLWSILRIARHQQGFIFLQPKATAAASLAQLNKFSVFSKVTFAEQSPQWQSYVITGEHSAQAIQDQYQLAFNHSNHNVLAKNNCLLWQLAEGIYLLMLPAAMVAPQAPCQLYTDERANQVWAALQIEHGWPALTESLQQTYVPQMLNLDLLGGINFKKGCYIGQETIARMHYKGMNKRRMWHVIGQAESIPAPSTDLEIQIGENWRRAGAVISAVRYDNNVMAIQAVLPSDVNSNAVLRIKGQEHSNFQLSPPSDETESINE